MYQRSIDKYLMCYFFLHVSRISFVNFLMVFMYSKYFDRNHKCDQYFQTAKSFSTILILCYVYISNQRNGRLNISGFLINAFDLYFFQIV